MPEFHLDLGSPEGARTYSHLDSFTRGYIEAMFFTDASSADDGDLEHATFSDIAPEALAKIIVECQQFQAENADELAQAYDFCIRNGYDEEKAGRDYWYTRNGHGTGFWDRGLGDVGDKLANAARYSTVNLYRGDDGQVYLS